MQRLKPAGNAALALLCTTFCVGTFGAPAVAQGQAGTGARPANDSMVAMFNGAVSGFELPTGVLQLVVDGRSSELPVSSLSQLLSGRFAGVQVLSTGAAGTASRIRIRGQSSLLLSNDPLVLVDGARLFKQQQGVNNEVPSRLDDINVDEIAKIEILSGPSATTLYGTDASNGVINITTKRGAPGRPRLNVYTENGLITDPTTYPDLWMLWGRRAGSPAIDACTLPLVSSGACVVDSLRHGNVLNVDSLTPIANGYRSQYGLQFSAGSNRVQLFAAGEREDETGVYRMPDREIARLRVVRNTSNIPDNQIRPSALYRNSARLNASAQLASWLSLDLSSAYVNGETRVVPNGNNSTGLGYASAGGRWRFDTKNSDGTLLAGYALPAGDVMSQTFKQGIDRYVVSALATLKPATWLSARALYTVDDASQLGTALIRNGEGPPAASRVGSISVRDEHFGVQTLQADVTASYRMGSGLRSSTTAGAQTVRDDYRDSTFVASDFPAGSENGENASAWSTTTSQAKQHTGALFLQQVLSFDDKLIVTGALRRESLTRFGTKLEAVNYPMIGAAWVLSNHDFFPKRAWLNSLRLHSSYGTSGQYPGVEGAYFQTAYVPPGQTSPTVAYKPEYSTEVEGGADLTMFGGASDVAVTVYSRNTRDALVPLYIAPGASPIVTSGGRTENRGVELSLNQRIVDRRQFAFSVALAGSANRNRLTEVPDGTPPIFTGNRDVQRNVPGYPLFGFWSRTYTYNDANADHIITQDELTVSDTLQYIGPSFPTRALAVTPTIDLFNRKVRVSAQVDRKWGFMKFNNTLRHQCQSALSCQGAADPNAPLEQQAAAVAVKSYGVLGGFLENGSFTRFRELSVAYEFPTRWANAFRAKSWNVVLTGRNLGVATNYSGADPESSVSATDTDAAEYFSTPPMRYFTLRFAFRF